MKRDFTVAELWDLGLRGSEWYEDWRPHKGRATPTSVVDVRDGGGRGPYATVEAVFRCDDVLWRVTVEFPPEDWNSNELNMSETERGKYSVTAVRVEGRTRTLTVYEPA